MSEQQTPLQQLISKYRDHYCHLVPKSHRMWDDLGHDIAALMEKSPVGKQWAEEHQRQLASIFGAPWPAPGYSPPPPPNWPGSAP